MSDKFLNTITKSREPTIFRSLFQKQQDYNTSHNNHLISFGGGVPHSSTSSFQEIQITLRTGQKLVIDGAKLDKYIVRYNSVGGCIELVDFFSAFHDEYFGAAPYDDWALTVTNGNTHGFFVVVNCCCETGDTVIVSKPDYSTVLDTLRSAMVGTVSVEMDEDGMNPESLRDVLENWDCEKRKPRLIYVIPNGSNPGGTTMPLERRREIYQIACEHDCLIIEDDPYVYCSYTDEVIPTFSAIDTDRRVIRLDTVSKILGAGFRTGYICGPAEIIDKIKVYFQTSGIFTSALSQLTLISVFEHWGIGGFIEKIKEISLFYRQRRDLLIELLEKHVTPYANWKTPIAGFCVWLKLNDVEDTYNFALNECVENGLMVLPGEPFFDMQPNNGGYIRLSFSECELEDFELGILRLAALLKSKSMQ